MSYKKIRKAGKSFLVTDSGEYIGCSFSTFVEKKEWAKNYAKNKREKLLSFIAKNPNNIQFVIKLGNELYLTEEGEKFVELCNMTIDKKRVITPVKQTTEKLANLADYKEEYVIRAEQWITDLAHMSTQTHHPFSTKKPFIHPYNSHQRVFIDLYRYINDIHEGYVILGSTCTVNAIQSTILANGLNVLMRRKFGKKIKLNIVAKEFDKNAIEYVKYTIVENVRCMRLSTLTEQMVKEAGVYYEEGDACFKLKEWKGRYSSLLEASSTFAA